jgi:hypothetical protein
MYPRVSTNIIHLKKILLQGMKSGRSFFLLLMMLFLASVTMAQETDSIKPIPAPVQDTNLRPQRLDSTPRPVRPKPKLPKPIVDSVRKDSVINDSVAIIPSRPAVDSFAVSKVLPSVRLLFPVTLHYPTIYGAEVGGYMKQYERFNVTAPVQEKKVLERKVEQKDWMFYFFCGLVLAVAFINLVFKKYVVDLFRVFFNTSLRQKQLREQLTQTPLPSFLLNMIFCVSGGAFIFFVLRHYNIRTGLHPAVELLVAAGVIAGIYLVKFIFVSLMGWMFDRRPAAENYLFAVFLVNKVAGLTLIPFTMLLAYADGGTREVVLTLSAIILSVLALMRLTKGFVAINGLKVGLIPYLVFVGAFDIVPTMLVYKVLVSIFV